MTFKSDESHANGQDHRRIDAHHRQINQRGLERGCHEIACQEHDFRHGNGRGDGRVLDQLRDIVGISRQRNAQGLGQEDVAQNLHTVQADGLPGFMLADVQRLQASSESIGQHCAAYQAQTDDGRQPRGQIDSQIGQSKVDQKQVRQRRHVTHPFDETGDGAVHQSRSAERQ